MKKIIKIGLLSTVAFCHVAFSANPAENPDGSVNGVVITGEPVEAVMGVEDVQLTQLVGLVGEIRSGVLPQTIVDMFQGFPKIDIAACGTAMETQRQFASLRQTMNDHLDANSMLLLNAFLKIIVTPHGSQRTIPLADIFLGGLMDDMTTDIFSESLQSIYYMLLPGSKRVLIPQINTPADWVVVQFLGLFFDNAVNSLRFNVNMEGLSDVDLIQEVISGLRGVATLNIMRLNALPTDQQVEMLRHIAENRPKNAHIIAAVDNIADLESVVESIADPNLQAFSDGVKIDVSV